jgi:AhpD family alkylhydroperoxidase
MSNALADVAWESCLFEPKIDREIERYARRRMGVPMMTVRYFAAVPWVARVVVDLHPEFGLLMRLDPHTADLIGLIVSQENACRFCFAVVHASLWFQGMDQERIRRIERDLSQADLSPRARAAIDYARAQSRTGPAGARQAWSALRAAGYDAVERKEIAFVVALTDIANRVSTIAAVPVLPMERLPDQWAARLLRPLLGWLTGRRRVRGVPVETPAIDPAQPYGRLVAAFAGSPIAEALARTLDAMWSSPHLTRRCKLLIFAVVSRGLPCEVCELEISRALEGEGLDAATLAQLLGHLDAPGLSPVERALLPFARATLWYEPAKLQRQARTLRAALTPEQLIEASGVVALANGLCRMAAVVVEDPG